MALCSMFAAYCYLFAETLFIVRFLLKPEKWVWTLLTPSATVLFHILAVVREDVESRDAITRLLRILLEYGAYLDIALR